MEGITKGIIVTAAIVAIVVGVLYISQRVHWGCLLGNCAFIVTK